MMNANETKQALILSVGGGKGGVGKSMLSSNLGVLYAEAGFKVVIIDLDMGAANLHTIFGIRQPPKYLGEYFTTPRSHLSDYLVSTPVNNLSLIPGSGFVPELANLKHAHKVKVINQMRTLDADIIILDLGAGSAINVVDFFSMTNAGIIVTTPEPTAIVNAYEFLKNVVFRIFFRVFRGQDELLAIIKQAALPSGRKQGTLDELMQQIGTVNCWAAENMRDICCDLDFHVIFNQAKKPAEAELAKKLNAISEKYLGITLNFSGLIYHNDEVGASLINMCPISITHPNSITTKTIKQHAFNILKEINSKQNHNAFENQYEQALNHAQSDYIENALTQKRLQRQKSSPNLNPDRMSI